MEEIFETKDSKASEGVQEKIAFDGRSRDVEVPLDVQVEM
jgi:hypothetical protein